MQVAWVASRSCMVALIGAGPKVTMSFEQIARLADELEVRPGYALVTIGEKGLSTLRCHPPCPSRERLPGCTKSRSALSMFRETET